MNLDGEPLKPYLVGSAALHAGLILALAIAINRAVAPPSEVYKIDFIGPSNVIINRNQESSAAEAQRAAAGEAAKIAPESKDDEFSNHRHAPLPRPSILSSPIEAPKAPAPAIAQPAPNPASSGAQGGTAGDAALADMPNFPYPWYISQIRAALWNQWSAKMPNPGAAATVEFSILKDGSATDIRIESSSGESDVDYVALGAVQGAMPFPPLPAGFPEQFLKVHVRFKS